MDTFIPLLVYSEVELLLVFVTVKEADEPEIPWLAVKVFAPSDAPVTAPVLPLNDNTPLLMNVTVPVPSAGDSTIPAPATASVTPELVEAEPAENSSRSSSAVPPRYQYRYA